MKTLAVLLLTLLPDYVYAPPQDTLPTTGIVYQQGCTHGAMDSLARVIYAEVGHQPMETRLMVGRSIWNRAEHKNKPIAVIMNSKKQYNVIGSKRYFKTPNYHSRLAAWYCKEYQCKAHYFMNPKLVRKDIQAWFWSQHFEKRIKDVAFFYPK